MSIGSLDVVLSADTARLQSDLGKAAAIADARSRDIARSFKVVQDAIASQGGVSKDVLNPYLQQLDQATSKQKEAGHAAEEFGFKTAGAKRELLVLAHELSQGNFSRFGGSMLVLGERTGAASLLFSKAGLAALGLAGALAAVVVTIVQASNETAEFNKALLASGNFVGKTVDDMQRLSAAVATSTNTSQHAAAEATAAISASGKVSGEVLQSVAEGATAMSKTLGISIDDAVGYFTKLAEDPAKASAKLNETYHYLAASTYEQIKALEELGQKQQAVDLAQESLSKAAKAREDDHIAHLGLFARSWQALAADALKAWNIIADIGRPATNEEKLADARSALQDKLARGPTNDLSGTVSSYNKGVERAKEQIAALQEVIALEKKQAGIQAEQAQTQQKGIQAVDAVDKWQKQAKGVDAVTRELKKYHDQLDDIRKANPNSDLLDPKKIAAGEDAIRKANEGPKGGAYRDDAATKFLETQRQVEASLEAQLQGETKLTAAEQEKAKFTQLIADLQGKSILTDEQKSLLANKDAIQAQLDKNVALSRQVEFEKEIETIQKRAVEQAKAFRQQVDGLNASIASAQETRAEQYDRALGSFGHGTEAQKEIDAQKSIYKEFDKYKLQLDKQAANDDSLGSKEYQDEVAKIKSALADALGAQQKYFADLKAKQGDWTNGATQALQNYSDSVANVSADVDKAVSGAFTGAESALTSFVTTGKGNFKSLADSIIADLARIAIKQTITGPLASALGSLFGSGGGALLSGNVTSLFGGDGLGAYIQAAGLAKASGGPVTGGTTYLVGEQGPELFTAPTSGKIIPNHALAGGAGAAPVSVVINNTVGDVATLSMLRDAQAGTERRIAGAIARSQKYGGALA